MARIDSSHNDCAAASTVLVCPRCRPCDPPECCSAKPAGREVGLCHGYGTVPSGEVQRETHSSQSLEGLASFRAPPTWMIACPLKQCNRYDPSVLYGRYVVYLRLGAARPCPHGTPRRTCHRACTKAHGSSSECCFGPQSPLGFWPTVREDTSSHLTLSTCWLVSEDGLVP